jgi:hypothetical protein
VQDESYYPLGHLDGAEVGVQPTLDGQDILIEHGDLGQRFASLLTVGQGDMVRREGAGYWRIRHDRQVDNLVVELIDLLISIRYAHPTLVQLELTLDEGEGAILEPAEP